DRRPTARRAGGGTTLERAVRRTADQGKGKLMETTTEKRTDGANAKERAPAVNGKSIVELRGVTKVFYRGKEPLRVLEGINLDVPEGSFEALRGPSGSGKTTLLNLIAGLDRPSSGTAKVANRDLSSMSDG